MSYAKILVDIFHHIRNVAARVANLFLVGAFGTPILGGEVVDGTIRKSDGGFV